MQVNYHIGDKVQVGTRVGTITDVGGPVIRHEANLAWALVLAAKPHLDAVERNDIFVAIGAGETFAAIHALLKWVAIKRIPMEPDLVQRCISWLDAYVGHEDERCLRRLIEDFVFPIAIQALATLRVNRLSTESTERVSDRTPTARGWAAATAGGAGRFRPVDACGPAPCAAVARSTALGGSPRRPSGLPWVRPAEAP
jgi:hypothetical protein